MHQNFASFAQAVSDIIAHLSWHSVSFGRKAEKTYGRKESHNVLTGSVSDVQRQVCKRVGHVFPDEFRLFLLSHANDVRDAGAF